MMTDEALLSEFRQGRPDAFRELVERHGGVVYGVAWRVTGDRMLAEEAMQDVFCLLAKKSGGLFGHPRVVGWLHRTALNVSRDLRRRRIGHERKLARFAEEWGRREGEGADPRVGWEEVDAAIDRLPRDEREVVVLRFFEDLDHAAIGRQLGISEAAARKRLSRGLARLQKSVGAPTGSLAVAPSSSALAAVVGEVPAVGSGGSFTILTFMTHKQLAAGAAILLMGGASAWYGYAQHEENRRLEAELTAQRSPGAPVPRAALRPGTGAAGEAGGAGAAAGGEELAAARVALAEEVAKRERAEADLAALRAQTEPLRDQVVVAYGKVSEIGGTLGSLFTEARALVDLEKAGKLDDPDNAVRVAKFMEKAASISGLSKEIIDFEDDPAEGSRFVAAAYGSVFGLEEADQEEVAAVFRSTLEAAKEQEFTLSHLPERGSAEFGPWLEKRWEFFNNQRETLRSALPEAKRADFDQWVEKGGYGFKNLTMKGFPLMFSLGGDPR